MGSTVMRNRSLFRAAILLAILVLLNVISVRLFTRADLTRNDLFTLSEASRGLMRSLDDRVTVRAYFTEDLPAPYNGNRRLLLDQLNEYRAYSGGNFQFEFIDPSGEKGEQAALQEGIVPVQVQTVEEDRFQAKRAFMGLVFLYEDRKEVIPLVQNMGTLEYDISSTVKRLVTRTRKKVGFLTGHGEPGLNELTRVQEFLGKQYDVTTVNVAAGAAVPADIALLVVLSPASRVPETAAFQIDQYLMRGGRAAFLLNRVEATLQQQFGRPLETGLEDLLAAYGVRVNQDLVRDAQCASVSLMQQQFGFSMQTQVPYPYLPLASDFSEENMMVKDLQGIVFFFASSVDTAGAAAKGLTAEVLVRSSGKSGRQSGFFMLDPLRRYTPEDVAREFGEGGIPLAVMLRGSFRSAFEGKPAPADTTPGAAPPPASPLTQSPETRIVVVGDGDFVRDQTTGNRDNLSFFANMADFLVDDAGLISIRVKDASMPPLEQVSDGTKAALKYSNLFIPPLLVLGYGLLRWRIRTARKKALSRA